MGRKTETCSRCKNPMTVDRRGMIEDHFLVGVGLGSAPVPRCPGSGGPPLTRLESADAARRILTRITTDPNRATKQACDLLLELIRQDARNDPGAIAGLSVADFQKVVAEVATDLVQERAFR